MAFDFRTPDRAYFFDNLSLIGEIYGKRRYVAIFEERVVDSELDRNALLGRLRMNFSGKRVCIGRVGDHLGDLEGLYSDSPDVVKDYRQAEGAD